MNKTDIPLLETHKHPNKYSFYIEHKGQIFWSNELKVWVCTDPKKISLILEDKNFIPPTFEVDSFEQIFNLNFKHTKKIISNIPLNMEGPEHIKIKKEFALQVSKNLNLCLNEFSLKLDHFIKENLYPLRIVDIIQEILLPALDAALLKLFDIEINDQYKKGLGFSQMLDKLISIKKRLEIENNLTEFIASITNNISLEEKYSKLSQFVLGYDSILSTLTSSIYYSLKENQDKKLSFIQWSEDIPSTGVPFTMRVAKEDSLVDNETILKGQAIRLYLESAAYTSSPFQHSTFSELFFGHGVHKCIGAQLSKKIWAILIEKFKAVDSRFIIKSASLRDNDYLFLQYENLEIALYE